MQNVHKKNSVPLCLCAFVPSFRRGFTLVELMIVMGVIIILVAMLFPVVIGMKDNARKKRALTEAHTIVLALKNYRMEFGKWPNQSQATNDTTYFTNNYKVILPLIGQNARGKVFLSVQATNQTDSVTNFIDPWGVPYVIGLDEDMNANVLINISNVPYGNIFSVPPATKWYIVGASTNALYSVANVEVAVASFAGATNSLSVETWSEPQ